MNYDGELRLLMETFQKCRVAVSFLGGGSSFEEADLDDGFHLLFGEKLPFLQEDFLETLDGKKIYRLSGDLRLCFMFLRLPRSERIMVIGPYLSEPIDQRTVFEIAEKYHLPPHQNPLLMNYYSKLPFLPAESHLFTMLDCFADRIFGSDYTVEELNERLLRSAEFTPADKKPRGDEILLAMKQMEDRYAAENELINAVSRGQLHKATLLMNSFPALSFEKRLDDPLRNLKNYSIIMNTLLRKAAEKGGVHPIHLDEMSSTFARRIEQLKNEGAVQELMGEMFRSYCLLVRKRTLKKYSAPVQKAMLMIDADLSAELSLRNLASAQNINAAYLSDLFKRETGQTITAYVNGERMRHAAYLLETTKLQIQTIAAHCGILDVQYFSKLFKKHYKKSPREWRDQ